MSCSGKYWTSSFLAEVNINGKHSGTCLSDLRNIKCKATRAKPQLNPAAYPHPSGDLQRKKKKERKRLDLGTKSIGFSFHFSNKFLEATDWNVILAIQIMTLGRKGVLKEKEQGYEKVVVFCNIYTKAQMRSEQGSSLFRCFTLVGSWDVYRCWHIHTTIPCSASNSNNQPGLGVSCMWTLATNTPPSPCRDGLTYQRKLIQPNPASVLTAGRDSAPQHVYIQLATPCCSAQQLSTH